MKQKNLHIKIHLGKTNSPKIEKARTFCITEILTFFVFL